MPWNEDDENNRESVRIDDCRLMAQTDSAVKLSINKEVHWIPKSLISFQSMERVYEVGYIELPRWKADELELNYD